MKAHFCLLFPLILSSTAPLHAALLVYEGFDSTAYKAVPSAQGGGYRNPASGNSNALFYDDDTNYKDGPEGTEVGQAPFVPGFTGAWDYTSNISPTVHARLEDSQLSYPGLTTTTGQLNLFRSGGAGASKGFSRAFDAGPSTNFTNTLFIGGLIWRTADTSFYMDFNMTNGTDSRSFGMDVMADGSSRMDGYGAETATSAGAQWATGTAEYFVLKLENSILDGGTSPTNGDRMTLYINPDFSLGDLNTSALEIGDATSSFFVTGNSDWTLGTFRITSNLADAGQSVIFDEFKIGTEWADMADVIPEPGTGALALVSLLLACRRRR